MGLFSKKQREPVEHPEIERSIIVPAAVDDVVARLRAYSDLHSQKHARSHELTVGESDGWVVVGLPRTLHPWTFHNIGFWLLDTPGEGERTILRSGPAPHHGAYDLVRDPEIGDCLCGVDDAGNGWTVLVPTNEIVRPESVPARAEVPEIEPPTNARTVAVLMEDPGHDMNPANEATRGSRSRLATVSDDVHYMF